MQTQASLESLYLLAVCECLDIPPDELEKVAGERRVLGSLLKLLTPRPSLG